MQVVTSADGQRKVARKDIRAADAGVAGVYLEHVFGVKLRRFIRSHSMICTLSNVRTALCKRESEIDASDGCKSVITSSEES